MIVLTKYGTEDGVLLNEDCILGAEIKESKYQNKEGKYECYTLVICKEEYKVPVKETPFRIQELIKEEWEI
jgi:hypothetical protein